MGDPDIPRRLQGENLVSPGQGGRCPRIPRRPGGPRTTELPPPESSICSAQSSALCPARSKLTAEQVSRYHSASTVPGGQNALVNVSWMNMIVVLTLSQ